MKQKDQIGPHSTSDPKKRIKKKKKILTNHTYKQHSYWKVNHFQVAAQPESFTRLKN